jgi:hypothetical protein
MLAIIKENGGGIRELLRGGKKYFFRVLLPQLIIIFTIMLVFIICTITFALLGQAADIGLLTVLTIGIMIPTLLLTFFFDTTAVFEDRRAYESIQRSIVLVSSRMGEVLSFLAVCVLLCAGVILGLMILWEALLFDKLRPVMDFTDAQREAFTPDQLVAMIGSDGVWISAVVIFLGVLILLPLLYGYKAFFFKDLARDSGLLLQPQTGEYDSKGRWYKY